MKTIPVIIPYFRAEAELKNCLACIESQSYKPVEIFVRDNSQDNILFTAAVNEGLRKFSCKDEIDYELILNQDAYLHEDTLSHLVQCMEKHPDCGIACPVQVSEQDNAVYWGGSYEAFPFGRHRCDPLESYKSDFETHWANGAAMLIRTAMVREIGLLDENMKFICSDSDYSFTARSRGWKVVVAGNARVYHSTGASGAVADDFIDRTKIKDAIYFSRKWLSGDLYRKLSYEGEALSRLQIKFAIDNLERLVK